MAEPVPRPAAPDFPAAPDGGDRLVGGVRSPRPAAVRGPAAGVPDVPPVGDAPRVGGRRELPSDRVDFQHASERWFARLLDFYRVTWAYEPDEFPIEWDAEGAAIAWFRPDFYLPDFDLYIEITTSQQRLVTRKNRKLRLLREHHPGVRCKLFYQRDVLELVRRFGADDELDREG